MAALFPEHMEVELPLGGVFEAPTIADLAVLVERLSGKSSDPIGVMLTLRTVSKNAHRPLFCIHPMAGISLGFSSLLRHLDPSMPVYGLQSRGLRSSEQLADSIEQIAADYLAEIRRVQPDGPYRIVGRSLGGLIGHAIVERMQAQGLEVEMLAMIDSYLFAGGELTAPRSEFLQSLWRVLVKRLGIDNLCGVMINHLALARSQTFCFVTTGSWETRVLIDYHPEQSAVHRTESLENTA